MQSMDILGTVITFVAEKSIYLLLAVLVLNMSQRRYHKHAPNKRLATLYISILILVLMCPVLPL